MNEVLLLLLGALVWIGFRAFFRYLDVREGLGAVARDRAPQQSAQLDRVTPSVLPRFTEIA